MSSNNHRGLPKELDNAIKMLGDEWILCIIYNLSIKSMRFSELQRSVEGINPVTLTNRLKKLEKDGLVKREVETLDKLSVVYNLKEKGRAILPIMKEIKKFSEKFRTSK